MAPSRDEPGAVAPTGAPEGAPTGAPEAAPKGPSDRALTGMSEAALSDWGRRIGELAARPLVLALRGELGAGKSVLARAIARGAGVTGPMPSPTFNLVYRYEPSRGGEVYHLDLYRLEDPEEVWELGWRELGEGEQIVMIEWAGRAEALLPEPRWDVELTVDADPALRTVVVRPVGCPVALPSPAGSSSVEPSSVRSSSVEPSHSDPHG